MNDSSLASHYPFGRAERAMIPSSFQTEHPVLSRALTAMSGSEISQPIQLEGDVSLDLARVLAESQPLHEVADALLASAIEPERELARLGHSAYRNLGVSDATPIFMGRLWAAAIRTWTTSQRAAFLTATTDDPHEVFASLDFTAELFRHVRFSSSELLPWLKRAHIQVRDDFMQGGFWTAVDTLCDTSPRTLVQLAMDWLDERPDAQSLSLIARITGAVRERLELGESKEDLAALAALDLRLQQADNPAWRSAYVQSWSRKAARGLLTSQEAKQLGDTAVAKGGEEETAWCYLLNVIAHRDAVKLEDWLWLVEQVKLVTRPGLSSGSQYWLVLIAMKGLTASISATPALKPDWLLLLRSLCPIPSTSRQSWNRITGALVGLTTTSPEVVRDIVFVLAEHSGAEWLKCEGNDFRWFLKELVKHNQHTEMAGRLCFRNGAFSRRLGMTVFAGCGVLALDPTLVAVAPSERVELLLLEAERFHIDYVALARLHASLAARVDQLAEHVQELLYDAVARQCRNTYAYRSALRIAASSNAYLLAIADDAEERVKETRESLNSPALRLDVPGFARAKRLYSQHITQAVATSVSKESAFLNMARKVRLLYATDRWRFFRSDGTLSEPSMFHTTSAEVEMPQFEIANPEEAQLRRLRASVRIECLELGGPPHES